jgi:hypothetical protein
VFRYPEIESSILLHGYTGAIDLVQDEITDLLSSGRETSQLPYRLKRTLIDRGHLTTKGRKEESEHVMRMLEVLKQKLEAKTRFIIEPVLPPDSDSDEARRILSSYFEIMDGVKSSSSYREVTLNLRNGISSRGQEFLDLVISVRNDWTLSAIADARDFATISRYADEHKIKETYLYSTFGPECFDEALTTLTDGFVAALNRNAIIVWLVSGGQLDAGCLERLVGRALDLKAKWPFGFGFTLISDSPTAQPNWGSTNLGGKYFSTLLPEEVVLYRRIKRFLQNPTLLISFEPCFYRGDLTVRFDNGQVFLSYGAVHRDVAAGDCRTRPISIDYEKIDAAKAELAFNDINHKLVDCPFCLICGCGANGDLTGPGFENGCNGFGERLHRILPPLFY